MDDSDSPARGDPRNPPPEHLGPRRSRVRRPANPTPEELADAPEFDPVPRRHDRADGWSHDRQRLFVKALAATGCVSRAAARVGMSSESAYALRRSAGAEGFARAWAEAQATGVERLEDVAFDRALNGTVVPVMYKGEQVAERRVYNDRLLMFTLRHHKPDRYGVQAPANARPVAGERLTPAVVGRLKREWESERLAREEDEKQAAVDRQAQAFTELWDKLQLIHYRMCEKPDCAECRAGGYRPGPGDPPRPDEI